MADQASSPTQPFVALWNSLSVSVRLAVALLLAGAVVAIGLAASSVSPSTDRPMIALLGGHEFSLESRRSAIRAFNEANLHEYAISGSNILVPKKSEADYLGALASSTGGLPGNTDSAIDQYITEQRSWWASTAESERLFRVAEERRVARVIETFAEIDHASVLVSDPPPRGTLRASGQPGRAAVKVTTVDGRALHPQRIEQIKNLVAGKFRDVGTADRVEVMSDGLTGQVGAAGVGGIDPALLTDGSGRYLMTKAAFAMQIENKIKEMFADLKGLIVSVNAELDPRYDRTQSLDLKDKGPVARETSDTSTSETNSAASTAGGEPGTRPNVDVPATPNQGALAGKIAAIPDTKNDELSEKEYDNSHTLTDQSFVDFEPIKVGVVVRYRTPPAGEGEEPTAEGPQPQQIQAMIASLGYPGVTVDTVSVQPYIGADPPPLVVDGPGTLDAIAKVGPSVALGILGFAAIVVALLIARRAPVPQLARLAESAVETPKEDQPKATTTEEESLQRSAESMAFDKIQDQVNHMVKSNPEVAAAIIRRWVLIDV